MGAAVLSTHGIKGVASLPPDLRRLAPRLLVRIGRDGSHVRLEQLYRWGAGEVLRGDEVRALVVALIADEKVQKSLPGKDPPRHVRDEETVCLTSRGQAQLDALRAETAKPAPQPPVVARKAPAPPVDEEDDEEEAPESSENDADDDGDEEEDGGEEESDEGETAEEDGDCDDVPPPPAVEASAPTARGQVQREHAATTREQLVALLARSGEMASKAILAAIPQSRSAVMRALHKLVDAGEIERCDYGTYRMVGAAPVAQAPAVDRKPDVSPEAPVDLQAKAVAGIAAEADRRLGPPPRPAPVVDLDEQLLLRCLAMTPEQRDRFVDAWRRVEETRIAREEIQVLEAAAFAAMGALLAGKESPAPAPQAPAVVVPVAAPVEAGPEARLPPSARKVLAALRRRTLPVKAVALAEAMGLPIGTASGSLSLLRGVGLADSSPDGWKAGAS